MKYRKSTIYDVMQVPGPDELMKWGELSVWLNEYAEYPWYVSEEKGVVITDFRGDKQHAGRGDYLVRVGNGKLRFYSRSIFEAQYEVIVE